MKKEKKTFREELKELGRVMLLGFFFFFLFIVINAFMVSGLSTTNATVVFRFDEGTGKIVNSSVGGVNYTYGLGNSTNIWTTIGKWGNASYLYGANWIAVNDTPDISPSQKFTINLWLSNQSGVGYVFRQGTGTSVPFYIYIDTTLIETSGYDGGIGRIVYAYPNTLFSSSTYTMVTYGNNGTHRFLYVNGTYINSTPNSGGAIVSSTEVLGIGSTSSGANRLTGNIDEFIFFNERALTSSEITELWNSSYGLSYPFIVANNDTVPQFVSQTPASITTTNLYNTTLNITYNYTDKNKANTSPFLNWSISNGTTYVNGSIMNIYTLTNYTSNQTFNSTNANYTFVLDDDVYPGTYNVLQSTMDSTIHSQYITSSNSQGMKVSLLNVSGGKTYSILEAMVNVNTTGTVNVYYCNSSYVSGNPSSTSSCVQFGVLNSSGFEHNTGNSHLNKLSMVIINGSVGTVPVTSLSYFVFDRGVGSMQIGYINGSVRTNVTMTTTNGGLSWTDQNWTADLHLHQYNGTEVLNYTPCYYNRTGTLFCGSVRLQNIGIANLPPTAPQVMINITTSKYGDYVNVTWTNSSPSNITTTINNYLVRIIYDNLTILKTLSFNATNNSIIFYVQNISIGDYFFKVVANDSASQQSFGLSSLFSVHNAFYNPCNTSIVMNSSGVSVFFNYTVDNNSSNNNVSLYHIIDYYFNINTTGIYTLTGLFNGTYNPIVHTFYSAYNNSELISGCNLYVCVNNWQVIPAGCIGNLKLTSYHDTNNCVDKYDVPIDNGTYVDCVTPPNTDKDLWIILILFFVFLVLLGFSVIYPFVGIGSLFIGVILMFLLNAYFTTTPFIYFVALPVVALIIAGFGVIWSSRR